MPDTSWALVHDEGRPSSHVAGVVAARMLAEPADATIRPLLEQWGAFVLDLAPRAAFAATADNVAVSDRGLHLACDLRTGVEPLDDDATMARLAWHLARFLVVAGAADDPSVTIDSLAWRLAGRSGLVFTDAGFERAKAHEATQRASIERCDTIAERARIDDEGTWTMRDALANGAMGHAASRHALAAAWVAVERAKHDCARAEAATIELAATRALAASLGAELERDEWIRARLRKVKNTRPVRLMIAARKRALKRS